MGTLPVPDVAACAVDHTVVSVGPYTFHSARQRWSSDSASSRGSASPPVSAVSPGSRQSVSSSSRQVLGVAWSTVAPQRRSRPASREPSTAMSRDAMTTCPPTDSGRNSSSTAMSNDSVVTATSTSCADRPVVSRSAARKRATAPCGTCTPLGRPVLPEVKSTYATASGDTASRSGEPSSAAMASASPSSSTTRAECGGRRDSSERWDTSTGIPLLSTMYASRSVGNAGSSGT
ncbi:hypothetical protein ASNO1_73950 [Corallococcus caeni]|uniref:Uncharacterized protein n=1 Tax=Corallococcus caeni TaxID=3082388 RepID=A0ABQ6R4H1_9BACT|nr:hypothetical protein ASNO1_73950 [Corallococcus sp. NO1]